MGVTFVNAGTEGAAGSGTTVTPGSPSSPSSGDIWIATGSFATALTPTMHADWTLIGSNAGGTTNKAWAWWFRYAGSPPTNNIITTASSTTNRTAGIGAYRGCKASGTPHQASIVNSSWGINDLGVVEAGLIPAQLNTMIVHAVAFADDLTSFFFIPNGYAAAFEDAGGGTQQSYVDTTGTPDSSIAMFYKNVLIPNIEQRYELFAINAATQWSALGFALIPEPTHKIIGVTRNSAGAALGSCTVYLLKLDTGVLYQCATTTSDASTGAYSFLIAEAAGTYAVAARKTGSPNVFDITDFNLAPVVI